MSNRISRLALAIVVAVAVSVTIASAAQAGEFKAKNYGATVTGAALTKHQFQFNGGTIDCVVAGFDGKLAGPAENMTVAAEYSKCTTGGVAVTVNMTGCDYAFHAGATLENGRVEGSMEVQCAQMNEGIDIGEPGGCIVKILPQAGLGKLVYTNHPAVEDFDVDINVTGIVYSQNAACPMGEGVFANGTYTGQSTMTGESAAGFDGLKVE